MGGCKIWQDGKWVEVPCSDGGSGNTNNTSPPPGPDLFQLSVARYESVRARLRAYSHIHVSLNDPLPRTEEELSREADALFVKTAFWFDGLAYDSERLPPRTKEYEAYLQTLYARERDLNARAIALPAELREANEKLGRSLAEAEARERVIDSVEAVTDRMHARAERAATESVQWLTVASPREVLLVSAETVAGRKTAEREPMSVPIEPINLNAQRSDRAIALNPGRPPGPRPAPPGTADDKIAATEALLPRITAVTAEYELRMNHFLKVNGLVDNTTPRVEALEAAVGPGEKSLGAVEALTRKAESRASETVWNGYRAGANAARAIAEAYILETFRDKVVIPEVKRFLRANGIMQKIDRNLVVQFYTQHKSFLPASAGEHWEALSRLISVEKRALVVLDDFETYMLAAVNSCASPTDTRGDALAAEIRAGTEEAGEEIIQKAAGGAGPIQTIVRAIMGRRR